MKVRDIMTTPVLTLSRGEPASDALARMRDARVRHGVVVSAGAIVGVVSARDLGDVRGGVLRKGRTVGDLMSRHPVLAPPTMEVTKAALVLREKGIGCLPVVEDGKLVGIVTRGDVLYGLAKRRRAAPRPLEREPSEVARPPLVRSPNRDKSA